MTVPAVFLDRDGMLNVDMDFVHPLDEWRWFPGALEALRGFNRLRSAASGRAGGGDA